MPGVFVGERVEDVRGWGVVEIEAQQGAIEPNYYKMSGHLEP